MVQALPSDNRIYTPPGNEASPFIGLYGGSSQSWCRAPESLCLDLYSIVKPHRGPSPPFNSFFPTQHMRQPVIEMKFCEVYQEAYQEAAGIGALYVLISETALFYHRVTVVMYSDQGYLFMLQMLQLTRPE